MSDLPAWAQRAVIGSPPVPVTAAAFDTPRQNTASQPYLITLDCGVLSAPGQNGHIYFEASPDNVDWTTYGRLSYVAARNQALNSDSIGHGATVWGIVPAGWFYRWRTLTIAGYATPTFITDTNTELWYALGFPSSAGAGSGLLAFNARQGQLGGQNTVAYTDSGIALTPFVVEAGRPVIVELYWQYIGTSASGVVTLAIVDANAGVLEESQFSPLVALSVSGAVSCKAFLNIPGTYTLRAQHKTNGQTSTLGADSLAGPAGKMTAVLA